jgi:hypothetical protein
MYTYGYLYRDMFDPFNPSRNQIDKDFGSYGNGQFELYRSLQRNATYILVISPMYTGVTGAFSILAMGAVNISFTPFGEYNRIARDLLSNRLANHTYLSIRMCGSNQ